MKVERFDRAHRGRTPPHSAGEARNESTEHAGRPGHRAVTERERRVSYAFSYFLVGVLVLVTGGLIEAFAPSWQL